VDQTRDQKLAEYFELCCVDEPNEAQQDRHQQLETALSCSECFFLKITDDEAHKLEEKLYAASAGQDSMSFHPIYVDRCHCEDAQQN